MFSYENEDSQITSPKDLSYIKQVATTLNRVASWPVLESKNKKYTFHVKWNIICFLFMSIIFILQIWYIRCNISTTSFVIMGHNYITLAMNIICLQRLTMPWMAEYRQVIKEFLENIHLFHLKDKSEYANKIYKKIEKICYIFTVFVHIQLYCGILLFNVTPTYKNFRAGMYGSNKPVNATYETAVYISLPFDYVTDIKGHIFVGFMGWSSTCIGSTSFCLWHLLLSLIVFHLWGNLKILEHNLDNFPKPANHQMKSIGIAWYTEEESKMISTLIVELVNHHRNIMDFISKTSSAYSFFLLLNFSFYQIVGCIILLECSTLDTEALGNYAPLTVVLFQQLIQISVVFEILGSQSEKIIDAVYDLPWECMELKERKLVLFFLQNVQEPINLKACGMIPVGVQTMAAILKACCSYFIMLRTVTSTEEMT
uniref:Odorant receptor n=1 Tax=Cydia pomonella TaxID=82600 RepID=H9A5M3_CYDPO|nr:odorant receptor 3 [Cydia pomonella]